MRSTGRTGSIRSRSVPESTGGNAGTGTGTSIASLRGEPITNFGGSGPFPAEDDFLKGLGLRYPGPSLNPNYDGFQGAFSTRADEIRAHGGGFNTGPEKTVAAFTHDKATMPSTPASTRTPAHDGAESQVRRAFHLASTRPSPLDHASVYRLQPPWMVPSLFERCLADLAEPLGDYRNVRGHSRSRRKCSTKRGWASAWSPTAVLTVEPGFRHRKGPAHDGARATSPASSLEPRTQLEPLNEAQPSLVPRASAPHCHQSIDMPALLRAAIANMTCTRARWVSVLPPQVFGLRLLPNAGAGMPTIQLSPAFVLSARRPTG